MDALKCIVGFCGLGIFCLYDYGFASLLHYLTLNIHGGCPLVSGLLFGATIVPAMVYLLGCFCHFIGELILGD